MIPGARLGLCSTWAEFTSMNKLAPGHFLRREILSTDVHATVGEAQARELVKDALRMQ